MEEQKKENQETEGTKKSFRDIVDNMPGRSVVLWCLAGFYLLYTGFTLCSNVIKGDGGIGFLLAGIVFLVIGARTDVFRNQRTFRRTQKKRGNSKGRSSRTGSDRGNFRGTCGTEKNEYFRKGSPCQPD